MVIYLALIRRNYLAAARTFVLGYLLTHFRRFDGAGVGIAGPFWHSFAEEFSDKYVRKGLLALDRHVAAHLGDTHENLSVAHPDRMIYSDIGIKSYIDLRCVPVFIKCLERFPILLSYLGHVVRLKVVYHSLTINS